LPLPDNRGSAPQRLLYDYCVSIYGMDSVIWEQVIPELEQRFDIFLKYLGIAIEFDGRQHSHYVEHFHKDMNGYINSKNLDNKKNEWAKLHNITVIRFDDSNMPKSAQDLRTIIIKSLSDSPNDEYSFSSFDVEKSQRLVDASNYRKDLYRKNKK